MDNLYKVRRYELKYEVHEELAAAIRDYIQGICILDPHVLPGERTYVVNNIYFDTQDLRFYYDTKFRKPLRFKARARFYGWTAGDYIWPELKFKQDSVVWKVRQRLTLDQWYNYFNPQIFEDLQHEVQPGINSFQNAVYWLEARPIVHVRYIREPYISLLDNYARITFDRQLCYRYPLDSIDLKYNEKDMLFYDDPVTMHSTDSQVIMEIKVETLVPAWVIQLIRVFDLKQRPFSKYCYSINNVLERHNYSPRSSIFSS